MRTGLVREIPFALGIALGLGVLILFGFAERRAEIVRIADFSGFWAGARALVLGLDPYDARTWLATTQQLGTQRPDTAVYGYPPHVALALVPFALLPVEVAAGIWAIATMLVAALGVRALLRTALPDAPVAHTLTGLALFASQPALTSFVIGQWTFLLVGCVALAVALALRGSALAGLLLTPLVAKPQLALTAPFALLLVLRGRRLWTLALMGSVAGMLAVAGWLAAPGWLGAWYAAVPGRRVEALPRNATTWGAAVDLFGEAGLFLAALVVVAGAIALLRFARRPSAALAATLAYGHVLAPYSWAYDQLLLLVPALAAAASLPARLGASLVAAVSTFLVFVSPLLYALAVSRGRESLSGVVPAIVFALLVVMLWRDRRAVPSP
ncbi:MAG TPA: glycosyltransferase family 87 protein [Candidatus Limnocylindria bacterium]|nr:glycosyltransferase family 87 protein [Candidatus Limnocylindria bacterium]